MNRTYVELGRFFPLIIFKTTKFSCYTFWVMYHVFRQSRFVPLANDEIRSSCFQLSYSNCERKKSEREGGVGAGVNRVCVCWR